MVRTAPARTDTVRRHNLALVLRQVHLHGALTRADLTERSGLSRSTIGGLVTELSVRHLVRESVPVGGIRAGRPSHVVEPRIDGPYVVAVDIDLEQVTTAAVGIGGHVLARHVVAMPRGPVHPEQVARHVVEAIPVLRQRVHEVARPIGIGISVPGTVDARTGRVGLAPNLGWQNVAFGPLMHAAAPAGLPVWMGNDADLAVLAEHRRGSARGFDDVVCLFGRGGVGAGILVESRPLRGCGGLAGEVGHTVLDPAGLACHCGGRGCVETYLSEAALLRLAGLRVGREGPQSGDALVRDVLRAAATGELRSLQAVRVVAGHLGRVVAALVNLLNPQLVVTGGFLRDVLLLARPEVQASLERYALASALDMVELRPAGLGPDSSLLGAAELAFGPLLADPSAAHGAAPHAEGRAPVGAF